MSAKITQSVMTPVERGMMRDPNTKAVLVADNLALDAYRKKRDADRMLSARLNTLEDRIRVLEGMLGEKR